ILTKAILDERPITLQEIASLKVGSTITLNTTSISRARLEIDDRPLFWCELGKNHQQLALRIESELEDDLEVVEEF
ncbi:MAG TPA: FliM/FliN family flagellar motor C-terminal domain-containing protein, partial [Hyphomicrobium sp.]|nr:FliM/FliN family flagellar motor C-terminal domain-containing protein [Hyphomicrobium sp.]